jgi:hypothetical protein
MEGQPERERTDNLKLAYKCPDCTCNWCNASQAPMKRRIDIDTFVNSEMYLAALFLRYYGEPKNQETCPSIDSTDVKAIGGLGTREC